MLCVFAVLLAVGVAASSLPDRQTDFGIRLFSQLARHHADANLAVSPHGVASVLAMAQLGAAGNTRRTLASVTGVSLQERGASRQLRLLRQQLSREGGVATADGVMVERRMRVEEGFRRRLARAFQAPPHQLDFSRPHQARRVVNAWVSDRTAGSIQEFLAPGSLTDETRLVLLSALHLQAMWQLPFDPKLTQERMFHCANGSMATVPMMRLNGRFNYGEFVTAGGVDYDVLELPYQGDALSMLLVAPFEPDVPLSALSEDLSSQRIAEWRSQMRRVSKQLAIPRFTLTSEVDLKGALSELGLEDMFNLAAADFTRITAEERLCVSTVLQTVKLEVDEQGTRGSAATAAVMFSRMAVGEFTLDRPFLFLIQHKPTGAVLFMGQLNHPQHH